MIATLEQMRDEALAEIAGAATPEVIEDIRVRILGRKGKLTEILRGLKDIPAEERPRIGQVSNEVKDALTTALELRKEEVEALRDAARRSEQRLDLTLPGRQPRQGHLHPIMKVMDEILDIFVQMGFRIATGPDVETEYYNFDSLNTPKEHPARDVHDTFFVKPGVVLRTHTSPVQMRVMEKTPPPVAVVVPGRTYRVDYDASHSPMFMQIEGLLVDEGVSFADLKGTLLMFARRFFGEETRVRFRPHFFPFTEPSAEMDISCTPCSGKGCRVCKHSGWLELLGCGMVHPAVFGHAGYDYEKYSGYAFGMGVDRATMLRHSIDSIGYLYENDLRFLEQF